VKIEGVVHRADMVDAPGPDLDGRKVQTVNVRIEELLNAFIEDTRRAANKDGYRWLTENAAAYGDQRPDEASDRGQGLLENLVETLTLVITFRFLNSSIDDEDVACIRRFLEQQRYGVSDDARGAALQVLLLGSLDVPIHVDDLADLDFADLHGALGFEHILIIACGGDLEHDAAASVAVQIHEDLNHDAALDTWWRHTGDMVLVGIDGESDDDRSGVQQFRGPLRTG
jgi:hypothetical protein